MTGGRDNCKEKLGYFLQTLFDLTLEISSMNSYELLNLSEGLNPRMTNKMCKDRSEAVLAPSGEV